MSDLFPKSHTVAEFLSMSDVSASKPFNWTKGTETECFICGNPFVIEQSYKFCSAVCKEKHEENWASYRDGCVPNLDPVYRTFGQWAVTHYGIELIWWEYAISKTRIHETDWFAHIAAKKWAIPEDFEKALEYARKRWG